jgi:hypothetical protein
MLFICASDLSTSEMALLGNNIRPGRRRRCPNPHERANRSLSSLKERVDRLHPVPARGRASHLAVAS